MWIPIEDALWLDKAVRQADVVFHLRDGSQRKVRAEGASERGCVVRENGVDSFISYADVESIHDVFGVRGGGRVLFQSGKVKRS